MSPKLSIAVGLLLLALPAAARAQEERFEVGQRLRRLDTVWDTYRHDPAAKKRAMKPLLPVVPILFAGQWTQAGQLLDKARRALVSQEPPPAAVQWADSLCVLPALRLVEKSADKLTVKLAAFYKSGQNVPENATLVLQLRDHQDHAVTAAETFPITQLPLTVSLPLKGVSQGDQWLRADVAAGGKILATEQVMISVVEHPRERLAALKKGLAALPTQAKTTDTETIRYLADVVADLADGDTLETNYPAVRLLGEAEAALAALQAGKSYYGHGKTGQFWLKLPTAKGTFVSRLMAPPQAKTGQPLPLVVALHGAGMSENLFFEGYGNGLTVKMCQERGWLLVSPRSGYLTFTLPVAAVVDEVAKLYPVDKSRVFVVGQSMGGAQAVAAAQDQPDRFAAVSVLGGSGKVTAPAKVKDMPFLIGVGSDDFALEGARRLAQQLKDGGVAHVELKEYTDVDHVMIVREALPDVFALFDKAAKK
jgi:predicted esterase